MFDFDRLSLKFIFKFRIKVIGTFENTRKIVIRFCLCLLEKKVTEIQQKLLFSVLNFFFFLWLYRFSLKRDCCKPFPMPRKCLISKMENRRAKISFKCLIWRFTFIPFILQTFSKHSNQKPFKSFSCCNGIKWFIVENLWGKKCFYWCNWNWSGSNIVSARTVA